jgi:hypothetical protein
MAIVFEANYSKKLGLPGYSSHQYSITIRAELADISQVPEQSEQIHALLQSAVDREIQKTGYLPSPQVEPVQTNANYGHQNGSLSGNGHQRNHRPQLNGHGGNGRIRQNQQRSGFANRINIQVREEQWKCSPKQQELILKMVHEHQLDKNYVEQLSMQLFGIGVRSLNKLQASGLIDELIREVEQSANSSEAAISGGRQ